MSNSIKCSLCKDIINLFKYQPMEDWQIKGFLCGNCYSKNLKEYYIKQRENNLKN